MIFSASMSNALRNNDARLLNRARERGMTLLEMLIALAVVAIVLTVVSPNVQKIIAKNRTTSEINELSGIIQFARYTAIDQSSTAIVCPSANFATCSTDWNQAKIVFIDNNGNNTRDSSEPLLMSSTAISSGNNMQGPNAVVAFLDSGAASASASIKICPRSGDQSLARSININAQGRVRISIDSDGNDIFEDINGDDLSCS